MLFFIDTANIEQIKEANQLGILDGVTTNPTLMAKEGITGEEKIKSHYYNICQIVDGPVSAEVMSTDYEGMLAEAYELSKLHPNIVVKVPLCKDGIRVINKLSSEGIKTNCTLIFSAGQALLAAKAGATYVSPFIGRIDDSGHDGLELIEQIVHIFSMYDFETQVLAASIRNVNHIIRCAEIGADVITSPLNSILGLLKHPLTENGIAAFVADAKKMGV